MTNEQKQLLLKDLCGRLPYGVICQLSNKDADISITEKLELGGLEHFIVGSMCVKPYLRPMSSITEEEEREFRKDSNFEEREAYEVRANGESKIVILQADCDLSVKELDWLNTHHFDYRGLISMGLALEAPEGMYKTE